MIEFDLQALCAESKRFCDEHWTEPVAELTHAETVRKLKREAKKIAAWKPRPPLPDEGINYRAELESMDAREREAGERLIAKYVTGKIFELPGTVILLCRAAKLEHLDGIEALYPKFGPEFDDIRPRMAQGLTYPEAFVSVALGVTRRALGRDSRAEFPKRTLN
ncbi:hypothetical protein [Paraburkholderia saeva]|uniref:Uncharacterized protein n=1 Tax=Paraburkholderia saeva TaxID=2777537 RepID=A0A9N8RYF4_9BURK|nr:hypothetical protein [Paraburkholderia saeva]CAG4905678.1 hypothetical protein LMG31841_03475 [Paraburkholderia saeva]